MSIKKLYRGNFIWLLSGNTLEFFDATLMGFLLPHLHTQFFGTAMGVDPSMGYLIFALSYFSRPLGAYFWGWVADHSHYNRALSGSVTLMALSTVSIGLIPSYDAINVFSPLLLGVCRFAQGFSVGGEYGTAASTIVSDGASQNMRGQTNYRLSLLNASNFVGAVLACLVSLALFQIDHVFSDAWRWCFFLSGGVGLIIAWKRRAASIPLSVKPRIRSSDSAEHSGSSFVSLGRAFGRSFFVGGLTGMPYMLFNIYLTNEMMLAYGFSATAKIMLNLLICSGYLFLYPSFGKIADRYSHLFNLRWGSLALALCGCVGLVVLDWKNVFVTIALQIIVNICGIFYSSGVNSYLTHAFPVAYRCRGVTTSHTMGAAVFGSGWLYFIDSFRGSGWHYIFLSGSLLVLSLLVFVIVYRNQSTHAQREYLQHAA